MDQHSSTTLEQPLTHKVAARFAPRVNLAGLSIVLLVAFMGGVAALAEPSSQAFTQGVAHIKSVLGEDTYHATLPSIPVSCDSVAGFKVPEIGSLFGFPIDAEPMAICLVRESLLALPPPSVDAPHAA